MQDAIYYFLEGKISPAPLISNYLGLEEPGHHKTLESDALGRTYVIITQYAIFLRSV